jgi:hypothetical protein
MERYRRSREASLPRAGEGLDPVVREWIDRPIGTYSFLIVDAIVIKIRKGDRVRSQSVLMATGVNPEGIREVLGLWLADSENEASWRDFFKWLKGRGLAGLRPRKRSDAGTQGRLTEPMREVLRDARVAYPYRPVTVTQPQTPATSRWIATLPRPGLSPARPWAPVVSSFGPLQAHFEIVEVTVRQ